MTSSPEDQKRAICNKLVKKMMNGRLMPFFGAGVNLTNRPDKFTYLPDGGYLPNALELSSELLREFDIPKLPEPCESTTPLLRCKWKEQALVRVSWYVSKTEKSDLYQHLHKIFSAGSPGDVHQFFAQFRQRLAEKGYKIPPQVIVTTNYDRILERAFDAADEPYDLFSYTMDRDKDGKFSHTPHNGAPVPIDNPSTYDAEIEHTTIVKIHGTVHPKDWRNSTFVITEDDYIDYAAFVGAKIPTVLENMMLGRRFLYLGYSLSDWNFRVFLRGLKARDAFDDWTWAIMHRLDEWDRIYWKEHKVAILEMTLEEHITILNEIVDALPKRA